MTSLLLGGSASLWYTALSVVFSTNVVCVKTQQKHCSIKHHDKPNNSISSFKIWYDHRPSFLFQNTIIPIQLTCLACFNAHMKYHTLNSCESLGMLHYTLIPSHCIQVDIERLLFSLAVKYHKFWGPKIDKKVINSYTKYLISVKIAILTPHIIPPPLVMFGRYLICRNMSTDYVCFWKSNHAFKKHTFFVWICSQLQIHTMLYVSLWGVIILYLFWLANNKKRHISRVFYGLQWGKLGMWVHVVVGWSTTHVFCRHWMHIFDTSFVLP